ncbi:tetratricopeptide repeat protein [Undibacterium sp.]|uniref:tetratricopeptide repeat protein n=1 Tax=Undibacterium sp. TaxID=1914977 RepID=UPI002B98BB58|nr:tetratricopeptide repeat protein [Undibacterium sp.]HTD03688.1 tetratricopeptide repeat protein [Undibacterium sp.]
MIFFRKKQASRTILICLSFFSLVLASATSHAQEEANMTPQEKMYLEALKAISQKRQKDASETLTRLIQQESEHAGAWLDLASIQCELGNAVEAERLFKEIETRFDPPPAIMDVINRYRALGCNHWQAHPRTSFSIDRGVDSNVNQGASNPSFSLGTGSSRVDLELLPEYLPKRDNFTAISADYARDLSSNGDQGFIQFRLRQNDKLDQYNTATLAAGAEHPWRFGNWDVRGSGSLGLLTLAGSLYQKQASLQTRVTPPVPLPETMQLNFSGGFSHVQYPTLSGYDASTWEVRSQLTYQTDKLQAQGTLGYIYDHATGARLGGDRKGWSAGAQLRTLVTENVVGEFGWSYQSWQSELAYSPGLIDLARRQNTSTLRASFIYPLKDRQALHVEIRNVRDRENISLFQYNGTLLQVGWQWQSF